jgi:hypothetical protein
LSTYLSISESESIHIPATVKEKRRSKSVHLMEPIHFDNTGNPTGNVVEKKPRSKTELNTSGGIRESSDNVSPSPSPSKSKILRRQSIKCMFYDPTFLSH